VTRLQEREARLVLDRVKKARHFTTIEGTCDKTILAIGKQLSQRILDTFQFDQIIEKLKAQSPTYMDDWIHLKISSFSAVCCVIYSQAFLVLVLRIQLGMTGGFMYRDIENPLSQNSELQERYLSLHQNLLQEGLCGLNDVILTNAKACLSKLSLSKQISTSELKNIFGDIRARLDRPVLDNVGRYLKLDDVIDLSPRGQLREIYEDTLEVLHSQTVSNALYATISLGYSYFSDQIMDHFPSCQEDVTSKAGHEQSQLPLAKLLPIVHGVVRRECDPGNANSFLTRLLQMDSLKILSANVYESYC